MNVTEQQKHDLLNKSKTFCMLPWTSINITPVGQVLPCCIAETQEMYIKENDSSLSELANHSALNKLRLDMINGVKNDICRACYQAEEQGNTSYRLAPHIRFLLTKYFDEAIAATTDDGQLTDFKIRHLDIRLSNICNMKCRTCCSMYSSQWEYEDSKQNKKITTIGKSEKNKLIEDVVTHIPYMDVAYFAGGEPLIAEEHYTLIEEMIRQGRTDILLRYNTNISNLKFKDKDLLNLWSKFKKPVQIFASIDDFGKRAEYIRSGTVWEEVEENFRKIKNVPYISSSITSVLSIFNFVTFSEFYDYLIDNNLYTIADQYGVINMWTPKHYTALALPKHLKIQGIEGLNRLISRMTNLGFQKTQIENFKHINQWVMAENYWEECREQFQTETQRLDTLRDEKFTDIFPHLAELMQ